MTRALQRSARRPARRVPCALLATLLALVGVTSQAHAQTGQLIGQVVQAGTAQPVVGARIRVDTLEAETDEGGMFELTGVRAGRQQVRVSRLGYAEQSVELTIQAGRTSRIRLTLTERAIVLDPVMVEALSSDSLAGRGAGFSRSVVTRTQLAQWEGTHMTLADVLRTAVPSVRVGGQESRVGSDICVQLRTIRAMGTINPCLTPAVYLDGVPITNPTMLFATLDVNMVESIEVIPAAEAGVRFGTGALYGALLIESRRPGRAGERDNVVAPRVNFDWAEDPQGHRTSLVLLASTAGSTLGVLVGVATATQCLHLRRPALDAIVTDCSLLPTLGAGAAAIVLPALGGSLGARLAGQTRVSQGRSAPAAVAAAMMLFPGYAMVLSGQRNDSDTMQWIGRGLIGVGAPVAATLSDYLFRSKKEP